MGDDQENESQDSVALVDFVAYTVRWPVVSKITCLAPRLTLETEQNLHKSASR